jgi:crotonobetainyl-CoA:carnitine CoA-transferase CaiB-like acyl-CoA transferase
MTEPHGPLQGVRVVACSTAQAGTVPYMLMADLGADVIKIEVPEGATLRAARPCSPDYRAPISRPTTAASKA